MFITVPHIQCDIKDCSELFRGDPGVGTDENSLLEQAKRCKWVIAETNNCAMHFCGASHARDFFYRLHQAIIKDSDPFTDGSDNEDLFWNRFISTQNARAMEQI